MIIVLAIVAIYALIVSLVNVWAHICIIREINALKKRADARGELSDIMISSPGRGWVGMERYKV